jgi:hypothetical protein
VNARQIETYQSEGVMHLEALLEHSDLVLGQPQLLARAAVVILIVQTLTFSAEGGSSGVGIHPRSGKTMQLLLVANGVQLRALLHSSSTHNFVDSAAAERAGIPL